MNKNKYIVFILSHGRYDRVHTYYSLRKHGYTGEIKIICDNEDKQLNKYIEKYGDDVIVFDKMKSAENVDSGDNLIIRNSVLYARNACYDIADFLGYQYFIQLDDDYSSFDFRINENFILVDKKIRNLDSIFDFYFDFFISSPSKLVAMAQSGDFIGGQNNALLKGAINQLRKTMNTFFCDTQKRVDFVSRMNDDVSTYVVYGSRGDIFIQCPYAAIKQKSTQQNPGGLTDMYLQSGTYTKSFYTVMMHPSSVKVSAIQTSHLRLHHYIKWDTTVPKIIKQEYKRS